MSFAPSSEQRMILQHVRDFCRAEIAPRAAEYDRSGEYPREQLRGLAELGLMGATVPEEWGGYLVRPQTMEFWQGRPGRMHDRLVYRRTEGSGDPAWETVRLAP